MDLRIAVTLALGLVAGSAAEPCRAGEPAPATVIAPEFVAPDGRFTWVPGVRARSMPRFGIALGGGGAWGIAHLGALEALAEEGLAPDLVAGTSIGAIVGSTYAAGYEPRQVEDLLRTVLAGSPGAFAARGEAGALPGPDPLDAAHAVMRRGVDRTGRPLPWRGVISDASITTELARWLGRADALSGHDLDRLRVPFRAVSTDVREGTAVVPGPHASLPLVVRASMGLPFFAPVRLGDRELVDGGVVQFVPAPAARAMGAEVVAGFRLARDERDISRGGEVTSFRGLASRYDAIALEEQRLASVRAADVRIDVIVGEAPVTGFSGGGMERLVAAGRAAVHARREALLAALEARATDARPVTLARIDAAPGTDPSLAAGLAARLGLDRGPATVSTFRVEVALCALWHGTPLADVRLEVVAGGAARLVAPPAPTINVVTVDGPPGLVQSAGLAGITDWPRDARAVLERVERGVIAARARGRFLAGITRFDVDPARGRVAVALADGVFDAVVTGGDQVPTPRAWRRLAGRPADIDALAAALDGAASEGSLVTPRATAFDEVAPGRYRVTVSADEPAAREVEAHFGFADTLVPTLWWRAARHADLDVDVRVVAGPEGALAGLEAAHAATGGFVRLGAGRARLALYDAEGAESGAVRFNHASLALGWRTVTPAGRVEAALTGRVAGAGASASGHAAAGTDVGLDLGLDGAWPANARPLVSWSLAGTAPLAGRERPWSALADVALAAPLPATSRWSLMVLARAVRSGSRGELPLDRLAEAGAFVEAPRLRPGEARAASFERGTLVLRRRAGAFAGMPIDVGASVAAWRLGSDRVDRSLADSGHGASAFVEIEAGRFGAATLGVAAGSERGRSVFVLLWPGRMPWPGPRTRLPGR